MREGGGRVRRGGGRVRRRGREGEEGREEGEEEREGEEGGEGIIALLLQLLLENRVGCLLCVFNHSLDCGTLELELIYKLLQVCYVHACTHMHMQSLTCCREVAVMELIRMSCWL